MSIADEASVAPFGTEKAKVPVPAVAMKVALVTCAKVVEAGVKVPTTLPLNVTLTVAAPP
jgi:hypothetical protein